MLRKCVCLVLVVWFFPMLQVSAAEGSVRIIPTWAGEPVTGGTVSIRRIGENAGNRIILTDGLAQWYVQAEEIRMGCWNLEGIGQIETRPVEDGQGAFFDGLEEGAYWVTQETAASGYLEFHPFLLTVPDGGRWSLEYRPDAVRLGEPPQTGDHPAPIIGAMGIGLSVAFLMVLADKINR